MQYHSTRDSRVTVTAARAITMGISSEGGLFVPEYFPKLSLDEIVALQKASYAERATAVLAKYLTDFTTEEISSCAEAAYSRQHFRARQPAPLRRLDANAFLLELWHGPTCAFKDMALQILPHLMRLSAAKTANGKEIVILVATSGDTGKAALEGFKDAPHTRILVFYPENGVSPMQKRQMVTQEGRNVGVCAIRGNFDDAQTGVKKIFADREIQDELAAHNMMFSSANSINWGRLVPQIVYYVSAYCDLLSNGVIRAGDPINVAVPTGNFGNILAAFYALKMGLPIKTLICASNRNCVLTDFFQTGTYDCNREFYTTSSPSMDILISSNLERLLYELSGRDDWGIGKLMHSLASTGKYTVSPAIKESLDEYFVGGTCDEKQTMATIREVYDTQKILCDTHTAVAVSVYRDYRAQTGDATPTVIASTANPYKFASGVLRALRVDDAGLDEFEKTERLEAVTGETIPAPLAGLRSKSPRFTQVCDIGSMRSTVLSTLGIGR